MEASTSRADNLALARDLFGWFDGGEMEALRGVLHPAVRVTPSIEGAPLLEGFDAVATWWGAVTAAGELELRPLGYEVRGECVIVRGYLRQRVDRMLAERPAFWVFEIREGQVVRMESCSTREAALARCS